MNRRVPGESEFNGPVITFQFLVDQSVFLKELVSICDQNHYSIKHIIFARVLCLFVKVFFGLMW